MNIAFVFTHKRVVITMIAAKAATQAAGPGRCKRTRNRALGLLNTMTVNASVKANRIEFATAIIAETVR